MAVYLNGKYLNDEDAFIHVSDLSIQRGYAVFDFLRTKNGKPLFIDNHLDRLFNSAHAMHLKIKLTKTDIKEIVLGLIGQEIGHEIGIRIMISGGYSNDGFNLATPNLLITTKSIYVCQRADFERGIRIITFEHQRALPHIKSMNYQMAGWLQPLLNQKGMDEVLYTSGDFVREFPRSNIFIVNNEDQLLTPRDHVLFGITRHNILKLGKEFLDVEERDVLLSEVYEAKEVFLTSTTKRIIPVLEIDGRQINFGKVGHITQELYRKYLNFEDSSSEIESKK